MARPAEPRARAVHAAATALVLALATAVACGGCGPGGRDVVVREADPAGGPTAPSPAGPDGGGGGTKEAYEHVARRPHVVLALAEARGVPAADARAFTESLAASFERCADDEAARGALVAGAARLVVVGGRAGGVAAHKLVVAPGADVAAVALVCLVAPARSLPLPRASARAAAEGRADVGLAFEASWSARADDGDGDAGHAGPDDAGAAP